MTRTVRDAGGFLIGALGAVLSFAGPALALDITTCGQVVPAHETGVLQADLVGCDPFAVRIENHGTLQMNSHAILGSVHLSIECVGLRCAILGPGEIANGGGDFGDGHIDANPRGRPKMTLSDLNIHDNGAGFVTLRGTVIATNVIVHHNVTLNPDVFSPPGTSIAVVAFRLIGMNLQVTDNIGFGIYADKLLRLTDSLVTGNNGEGMGIDFFSDHRPVLVSSTCGKSLGPDGPWGVCTNDAASPSGAFLGSF